jgi:putative restriction endonuclease
VASWDPDHELRLVANARARELGRRYDDLVPLAALAEGFIFGGQRVSFGSFQKGIHRPRQMRGPAALTLMTAARVPGKSPAYEDELDVANRAIVYHYRAGPIEQPDNRALRAALELQAPLIYFHGVAPGQYLVVPPVFVTRDDPASRTVLLEVGLPEADVRGDGIVSTPDVRRYALTEVRFRLHQQRFRQDVLRAYRHRCTVCALREPALVQAAHILEDRADQGVAAVVNGLALWPFTISRTTGISWASTPMAWSTSPVDSATNTTVRCSAQASRGSTGRKSCSPAGPRTDHSRRD